MATRMQSERQFREGGFAASTVTLCDLDVFKLSVGQNRTQEIAPAMTITHTPLAFSSRLRTDHFRNVTRYTPDHTRLLSGCVFRQIIRFKLLKSGADLAVESNVPSLHDAGVFELPAATSLSSKSVVSAVLGGGLRPEAFTPFYCADHIARRTGKTNAMTAFWATVFFWMRLAHAVICQTAIPYVPTAARWRIECNFQGSRMRLGGI